MRQLQIGEFTEKCKWSKHESWPTEPESWKKIQAWIVRKKMKPSEAIRAGFAKELVKVFKDVYPLLKFTSLAE
jgi:hypothetical protein